MNTTLRGRLGLLAGIALAVPPALAQESSVQLYGGIGAGVTWKDHQTGGGHLVEMTNSLLSSSLFGFRGREDLGGGLEAQFRLESGINTDSGAASSSSKFWNRQSFVGLGFGQRMALVTIGRQFHASTERVVASLDVYNVSGPSLHTAPLGLFGVNRFSSNDTRVDDGLKLRLNGPAGLTAAFSFGADDGAGRSFSFDLAQVTQAYTVAAYGVRYRSPNVIAATGVRPEHQVLGLGGQLPVGPAAFYLNAARSTLDATAANRPQQKNTLVSLGLRYNIDVVTLKAAYTHDSATDLNNVAGRDGKKQTLVLSSEYRFSRRTSAYVAAFSNKFDDGYRLDPINIAALGRDPAASSANGYSVGMRHEF